MKRLQNIWLRASVSIAYSALLLFVLKEGKRPGVVGYISFVMCTAIIYLLLTSIVKDFRKSGLLK
jgi:hypothetical protein